MFKTATRYIKHLLTARHTWGFGIHSPYMYKFAQYVVYEKNSYYIFERIEHIRKLLVHSDEKIAVTDFGTGVSSTRNVSDIAIRAIKPARYAQLLYRIVNYAKATTILELGTSLGITTAYLASVARRSRCVTMEGCPEIANIAGENLRQLGLDNVTIVKGNIDENLHAVLETFESIDFIFIDANHRYDAVMNYFNQCLNKINANTIMVVDDIHWSDGMQQAWKEIQQHAAVTSTMDLFHSGIVFFNPDLNLKHYKLIF
jgi:predicted O-methyltransferase YrrM